jgi:hypothetical protein
MKAPRGQETGNIQKIDGNRNGGDTMKTLLAIAFRSALALLAALLFLLTPGQVRALTSAEICGNPILDPSGDYDGDGFTNLEECNGLIAGQNGATISWPGYIGSSTSTRLDPTKRDLFVVLVRTSPSNIPTYDPYEFIRAAPPVGLGTEVREIPAADVQTVLNNDRKVIQRTNGTFQKAVKITESLSASAVLGRCDEEWATPNGLDNCFVFTKAIKDHVYATCAALSSMSYCKDSVTGATPLTNQSTNPPFSIYDLYIKHTIAHECGHDMKLRGIYVSSTGGYHYASTDKVVVSQSVFYKASKSAVAWYIGKLYYSPNDQQDFVLWQSMP